MRLQLPWPMVLTLSAQIINPSRAFLLDSGASVEPDSSTSDRHDAVHEGLDSINAPKEQAKLLVLPDVTQSGLSQGCRRSTDFFDQVCNVPSAYSGEARDQSGTDKSLPIVTADLLVCDVPEIEPLIRLSSDAQPHDKAPSATYAVSGTIVVRGLEPGSDLPEHGLPELGENSSSDATSTEPSYPGPNDEGFWRQRDGRHEWHPASHADANQSEGDRSKVVNDAQNPSQASPGQGESHLSQYDAWSAEQEQGTFLSFNEWKERYAQDSHAQLKNTQSKHLRKEMRYTATQAKSASSDYTAIPRRTDVHSEDSQPQESYPNPATDTSSLGKASTSHSQPATTATVIIRTEEAQKQRGAGQSQGDLVAEESDPSVQRATDVAQVGFSVAAGDTSAHLSRLKHRWNFASLDCAAVVHRTNPEAKFASSILSEKKDRYMLSPCPQHGGKLKGGSQFVIVELCEEIKIDTIVLANYEFFSNMFKKFTVTAAQQLTGRENDWTQLGVFRARNVRGQQVFRIPSAPRSEAFFRYVRIDFLEHFGSEFYCPVSLLRVYGITAMEEYKKEFEEPHGEADVIPGLTEAEYATADALQRPALDPVSSQDAFHLDPTHILDPDNGTAKDEDVWRKHEQAFQRKLQNQSLTHDAVEVDVHDVAPLRRENASSYTSPRPDKAPQSLSPLARSADNQDVVEDAIADDFLVSCQAADKCCFPQGHMKAFYFIATKPRPAKAAKMQPLGSKTASSAKTSASTTAAPHHLHSPKDASEAEAEADRSRRVATPRASGTPPTQQGNPGSESVYRTIHRRLNALESNATLSHNYIEHSGQMLREVFARMEKRQENRMSNMLRALNASNWQQIESLKRRQHVDLQRAIFEFDVHRQQADTERRALLREVHILAEEVLLEKRLSIAQLIMLLVVFVFVGLTRGSRTAPLLHSGFVKIGRKAKRRDAKADSKLVLPNSPRLDGPRMEQSIDAMQPPSSVLTGDDQNQTRGVSRHHSGMGIDSNAPRLRYNGDSATISSKSKPWPVASGTLGRVTSPRAFAPVHARSFSKMPFASFAGRSGTRKDSLTGMLCHPRTRGRLVILLETLDALDRAANLRRFSKSSITQSTLVHRRNTVRAHDEASMVVRTGRDLIASPSSDSGLRGLRSQRPTVTNKQDQSYANGRRLPNPGRDRKPGPSGFEDLAGMSSDWTERSENGEMSEHATYLSEEEEGELRAARSNLLRMESTMRLGRDVTLDPHNATEMRSSLPAQVQPLTAARINLPASSNRALEPEGRAAGTPKVDHQSPNVAAEFSGPARADGRLSSSDSESEGGAWHRVLPRRVGNGSSLRRARQGMIDGRSQKDDGIPKLGIKTVATDRRGSPRPSSAPGSGFKSQKPGFSRLFRSGTPDHASPDSPKVGRSGTPDTIRDAI
ncbi:uncharacterized protein MEPE_02705 [Melanopsichium pennsylvanicum]|uniref:SUN domain-containing protein n=2 Tax=Melanopsichium pennsylvanicum TaxID=63383 RepID=A0AAJ4XLE4_9BASI|nr:conserved hypothetical protein [Melanopsichium pennsylvanicum 4]SNX83997.1 uncharacterized protein MEPE_02705 [Melanopsichium pennsylvanicum]